MHSIGAEPGSKKHCSCLLEMKKQGLVWLPVMRLSLSLIVGFNFNSTFWVGASCRGGGGPVMYTIGTRIIALIPTPSTPS